MAKLLAAAQNDSSYNVGQIMSLQHVPSVE